MHPMLLVKKMRQKIMLTFKPKSGYWLAKRDVRPISSRFGFDRGTPIDRYWIDNFVAKNSKFIKDRVLEIDDSRYASVYPKNIKKLDILDINPKNTKANIHGDLRNLKGVIASNTYDCIILTQVLGMVDDLPKAVAELHRILKPGGVLLVTSSCLSPAFDQKYSFWRFTKASFEFLFSKDKGFTSTVETDGNALAGQAFWVGLSKEELTEEELKYKDPRYPCIVSSVAIKN